MNLYEPIDLNVKNYREQNYFSKLASSNLKFENKNVISSENENQKNLLSNNNNPINNQLALNKKKENIFYA
jgi:hypothetical protein